MLDTLSVTEWVLRPMVDLWLNRSELSLTEMHAITVNNNKFIYEGPSFSKELSVNHSTQFKFIINAEHIFELNNCTRFLSSRCRHMAFRWEGTWAPCPSGRITWLPWLRRPALRALWEESPATHFIIPLKRKKVGGDNDFLIFVRSVDKEEYFNAVVLEILVREHKTQLLSHTWSLASSWILGCFASSALAPPTNSIMHLLSHARLWLRPRYLGAAHSRLRFCPANGVVRPLLFT